MAEDSAGNTSPLDAGAQGLRVDGPVAWLAGTAAAVATMALAGWMLGVPELASISPAWTPMKPVTSVGLVFCALSAYLLCTSGVGRARRVAGIVLAAMPLALGTVSFAQYVTGWNAGIDPNSVAGPLGNLDPAIAGKMAPTTALALIFLGSGLWLLRGERTAGTRRVAVTLALAAIALGLATVLSHAYGSPRLLDVPGVTEMAFTTALAILALGGAIVLGNPTLNPARTLMDPGLGGAIARRMLPAIILIPPAMGWLRIVGQNAGLFPSSAGTAMLASGTVYLLGGLLVLSASVIADEDRARRRAEHDLAEHREWLQITLLSIGDAVISTDVGGRIVAFNAAAERLTGWSAAEAMGRPIAEVLVLKSEDSGELLEDPVQRVLRSGSPVAMGERTLLVRRDGSELPIADSAAPIRNSGDRLRGAVLVLRDQSREREAERDLRASQERYKRIVDLAAEGIWELDRADRTVFVNRRMAEMLGYEAAEMLGKSPAEFMPPRFQDGVRQSGPAWRSTGEERVVEQAWTARNGMDVWTLASAVPLLDDSGAATGYLMAILDITERKRVEQFRKAMAEAQEEARRSQEANRLKSEFLASMSHELRTPLNAIVGFSELLHDGIVGPVTARQKEYLRDVLASAEHLLSLINDVLDLAKVEAGKLDFRPREVDVGDVIQEVVSILRPLAVAKRIQVDVEIRAELPQVVVDPSKLKQVLYNYLSNAIKFTPEAGRVKVGACLDGAVQFRIEVKDNGVGVRAEDLGKLFSEFQQLDPEVAKQYPGTGLGLALTKRIVEAQGGRVGVQSTPGTGSTFYAILPLVTSQGEQHPPVTVAMIELCDRPGAPTVLVVEDDDADRLWLVQTLAMAGYNVVTAPTGEDAIVQCRRERYDAITLDLILPDMGGLEVLRQIRTSSLNGDVPVVVVTLMREKAILKGFPVQDVLTKPISPQDLLRTLATYGIKPESRPPILVVDDDPAAIKVLAASLGDLGYTVVGETDPEAGLDKVRMLKPAAVILDLMMPGMDGFQFLERLRRTAGFEDIPVIVWTVKELSISEALRLAELAQTVVPKVPGGRAAILRELVGLLPPVPGVVDGEAGHKVGRLTFKPKLAVPESSEGEQRP